jgi:hypothetical protein
MKDKKIPTIIGLTIIILGIAASVFLVNYKSILETEASSEILPKNVRVTNITNSSFTVSWTTDEKTRGFVLYGNKNNSPRRSALPSYEEASHLHWLTINDLKENSEYNFNINSNGMVFDNNGTPWSAKTGTTLPQEPLSRIVTGSVVNQNGVPIANALVYLTAGGSSPLSTITEEDGKWFLVISKARSSTLDKFATIDEDSTLLEITVQATDNSVTSAQVYPSSANPIPPITLGETNNFKNFPKNSDNSVPEASINLNSTFETEEVRMIYPNSETLVLTTYMEFKGTAPPKKVINFNIEPLSLTGRTTSNEQGAWSWLPDKRLPTGSYYVTLSWNSNNNQVASSEYSFKVIASQ